MEAKTAEGERKMKNLLAVCLMALVCWVCAGYAEETRVGDTVIFGQYEQDGNLDNGSEPIAWLQADFHAAFTDAEWAAIAPVTLADTAAKMLQIDSWFFENQREDFWENMANIVKEIFPTDELLERLFAPPAPESEEKPGNIAKK